MNKNLKASFYIGLFLLSFCLLASQLLLTRILSLVFLYHFVFLIVSVVMFGLTIGTLIIYLGNKTFRPENTLDDVARFSFYSAAALLLSFLGMFYLPAVFAQGHHDDTLRIIYCCFPILLLPFVLWGIAFSLLLTRFPETIGKIYAVNMFGSAAGCIGAYFILNAFNAPAAIFVLSALCLLAAVFFKAAKEIKDKFFIAFTCVVMAVVLAIGFYNQQKNDIYPLWIKGSISLKLPMYSKWNFFSNVSIGTPSFKPFGWGYSPKVFEKPVKTKELMILIDQGAGTVLTQFHDLSDLKYLKYDISNMAHHIRPSDSVLILGSGGGRDLLSAVLFKAKKVDGVELNKDIIDIVLNKFAYFSGSIKNYPQIKIYNNDGRTFVTRSESKYDLIQSSLVDSFSAAGTGAFALSENSLYTKEAWTIYLSHLTDNGILTFSRWYSSQPFEIYRLLSLAQGALKAIGIKDAQNHIALVRTKTTSFRLNVGTILVSKSGFTQGELDRLDQVSKYFDFEVVLTPHKAIDPNFKKILNENYQLEKSDADISPSTDDKPFYFYFSHLKNFFSSVPIGEGTVILRQVSLFIIFFGVSFILFPLFFTPQDKGFDKLKFWPGLYFSSIGLGFMFLEIPLIQRLGLFLGHPVYGLTVVLFSLLLACSLGSYYAPKVGVLRVKGIVFPALLFLILCSAFVLPTVLSEATAQSIPIKVLISALSVGLIGLFMGMPFPTGVAVTSKTNQTPLIFYWAINGFASMCAAAFATISLINLGFKITILIAFFFYLMAAYALRKSSA